MLTNEELLEENKKLKLREAEWLRERGRLLKKINSAYRDGCEATENMHQVLKDLIDDE